MIIDAHTHTFPQTIAPKVIAHLQSKAESMAYTDGTDAALQHSMCESGVDICVQLPVMTNVGQVEKLNDIALEKCEHTPETGLFSLGGIHPDYENYSEELTRIAHNGITGIKLHPAYQGVDLDDVRFMRIIDKANELGLAVVIHAGLDIGIMHHNFASVKQIENVMQTVSPAKFVLAHMGGWKDWDTVEKELCGENIYFDTSFSLGSYTPPKGFDVPKEKRQMLGMEQFKRMVQKHGADKILFGSDSPWSEQATSIRQIKNCGFTSEQQEHIFYHNAKAVFKLSPSV